MYGNPYRYDVDWEEFFNGAGVLLGFIVGLYLLILLVGLAAYILRGLAILNMSKRLGKKNGGLGFVPFAWAYQLGKLSGEVEFGKKKVKEPGLWALLTGIIMGALPVIFIMLTVLNAVLAASGMSRGRSPLYPAQITGLIANMFGLFGFLYLLLIVGAIFLWLLYGLMYHKIFSRFDEGQKPVFYTLLSLFVPLAVWILFLTKAKPPKRNQPLEISPQPPENDGQ
jgi:hypothetical protein